MDEWRGVRLARAALGSRTSPAPRAGSASTWPRRATSWRRTCCSGSRRTSIRTCSSGREGAAAPEAWPGARLLRALWDLLPARGHGRAVAGRAAPGWVATATSCRRRGNVADYARLEDDILQDCEEFDVQEICFDRALAAAIMQSLQRKLGDQPPVVVIKQSVETMDPAMKAVERLVR
jgi:hypothetical protein